MVSRVSRPQLGVSNVLHPEAGHDSRRGVLLCGTPPLRLPWRVTDLPLDRSRNHIPDARAGHV